MKLTPDLHERQALCEAGLADRALASEHADRDNLVRIWGACPWADQVTAYDRQHIYVFNWLLNGASEGASEYDMARVIFGLDPNKNRSWALLVVRTHLERARWLKEHAVPYLDW